MFDDIIYRDVNGDNTNSITVFVFYGFVKGLSVEVVVGVGDNDVLVWVHGFCAR